MKLIKHLKKTSFAWVAMIACVFLLQACSQGAIPGGGTLPKAAPEGVVYAPGDEAPIVKSSTGLVRAPLTRETEDGASTHTPMTWTGISN